MKHNSHTELYYHFTWHTHNNESTILSEWEQKLYDFIAEKCVQLRSPAVNVNGVANHMHVLLRASAMLSPAQIAHDVKGASSHMVNAEKLCKKRFGWQDGYGAFSVSPHDVEVVSRYIARQKEHHAKGSTQAEFEVDFGQLLA